MGPYRLLHISWVSCPKVQMCSLETSLSRSWTPEGDLTWPFDQLVWCPFYCRAFHLLNSGFESSKISFCIELFSRKRLWCRCKNMTIQRVRWLAVWVIPLLRRTSLKNMLSPSQDVHICLQLVLILPFLARLNISHIPYFHPVKVPTTSIKSALNYLLDTRRR